MKKLFVTCVLVVGLLLAAGFSVVAIPSAQAATTQQNQNLIIQIQQQIINTLQKLIQLKSGSTGAISAPLTANNQAAATTSTWCYAFNTDLAYGAKGLAVQALQTALQKEGFSISQTELSKQQFGNSTKSAVIAFQQKYSFKISPFAKSSGLVGPVSRAKLNQLYGCKTIPSPIPSPSPSPTPTPVPSGGGGGGSAPAPVPSPSPSPTPTTVGSSAPAPIPSPPPTPSPVPSPTPIPSPTPVTTSDKFWGAYTGNSASSFTSFQQQVGKKADINAVFIGWDESFPTSLANPLKANGQTLLIYWEQYGVTLDQIIAGNSDAYIRQFATQAKAYGGPVILAPLHEMNGNWDPWNGTVGNNTPAKVVAAWKHIHDTFAQAPNVKWGWAVNNDSVPDTSANRIENYYPGDAYVDYVGVDGFNFADPWQSYDSVFSSALAKVSVYNKPIYIFSMASAEGSKKPAWITDALSKIYTNPKIAGWIWFNENKEQNWLVSSSQDALKAFQAGIR